MLAGLKSKKGRLPSTVKFTNVRISDLDGTDLFQYCAFRVKDCTTDAYTTIFIITLRSR